MNDQNKSEIAFLMELFDLERQSAQWALTGMAESAKHAFITRRMERMGYIQEQLADLVGEDESKRLVLEVMEKVDKPPEQE